VPPRARRICLLDADSDLADQLEPGATPALRQAMTVFVMGLDAGPHDLGGPRDGFGLLLLDGLIGCETAIGDRIAVELLGAGDLLQADPDAGEMILERRESWQVLWPTQLAALDSAFADRVRPWPQIAGALVRRAIRRAADLDAVRAISGHPRLELRLDLAFWHLAARWGRVEPSGIHLALPLTHRLLGQLVAAERPSISHALARLSRAGLVTGSAGDWHLVGTPGEHLDALMSRPLGGSRGRAAPGRRPPLSRREPTARGGGGRVPRLGP
jgi:CRP-like cAMP-binding protein